jgi:hypothetical protein
MRTTRRAAAFDRRLGATAAALVAVLLSASAVSAGPLWDWLCGNDSKGKPCPPPAYYSKWRFWTPALCRLDDYCNGPKIDVRQAAQGRQGQAGQRQTGQMRRPGARGRAGRAPHQSTTEPSSSS